MQSPLCVTVNLSFSSLAIFSWPPDSAVPGVLPDVYGSVPAWKQVPDVLPESSHGYGFGVSKSVPGYVHVLCAVLLEVHRYAAQFGAGSHLRPEHQRHASFRNAPGDLRRITSQRQASDGDAG